MLINTLLMAVLLICSMVHVSAEIPPSHITDFGLVYGNVKYYYPTKKVKEGEWNKVATNILRAWEADSNAMKQPAEFHALLVKKYAEMGVTIHLYEHKPTQDAQTDVALQGKHWVYRGYPFSKNRFMIGPIAFLYNAFSNPYKKSFKTNTAEYLQKLSSSPHLSITKNELIVQLHDSLWLGLPWDGAKKSPSESYKKGKVFDMDGKMGRLAYIIDEWNILYHFSPTLESKDIWLSRLHAAATKAMADTVSFYAALTLRGTTTDAHSNFLASNMLTGQFYKIDSSFYYHEAKTDTSAAKVWRVLLYNGEKPDKKYNECYPYTVSANAIVRSYYALQYLATPMDKPSVRMLLQDVKSLDTFTVSKHSKYVTGDPGYNHTNGKARAVDTSQGIYYIDLKKESAGKVVSMLESPLCKAAILDIRGHPYISSKFIARLVTTATNDIASVIPNYSLPDRNGVKYDTVTEPLKPGKAPIAKPLVILCDESSISYSENLLSSLRNGANAVVVGRISAGTTGNICIAPIFAGIKLYDVIPFTPIYFINTNGTRFTGVAPDIAVTKTLDDLITGKDEIFDAGLDYLRKKLEH